MKPYQQQNYYELLELPTTASAAEIHSAYKRAMELHDPASAAMYALADPAQIEDLRNLLLRARDTLIDRSLRADYDRSLGLPEADSAPAPLLSGTVEPESTPLNDEPAPLAAVAPVPVRARPKEIPQNAEFNGELLRQIRESQGLSLVQVSERTRISVRHLENVEADRYDALPATVYLRGMVINLARELKLDPIRVARSYLALVAGAPAKQK